MVQITNPFITSGYVSSEYFCDREMESETLIKQVTNGNNLALISSRRMGKTGLIMHCFSQQEISRDYYTFFIDIYETKSLRDLVLSLSKVILEQLKPFGKKAVNLFVNCVKTLQGGISFDSVGNPSFNVKLGDLNNSDATLDEIFKYLNSADKPCIVAIDEFQQISYYPENNIEASLRTRVQHCNNARFIFAGSQRHIMGNMFLSPSRPFYQSVSMLHLQPIMKEKYISFAVKHFQKGGKNIAPDVIYEIYDRYEGITWYLQKILNTLYYMTGESGTCSQDMIDQAEQSIISSYLYNYKETLFRLPEKQKELIIAIAKEGKAHAITSSQYVKKYSLTSASSVQAAINGLLDKDFVTEELGIYSVYDKFFAKWLVLSY